MATLVFGIRRGLCSGELLVPTMKQLHSFLNFDQQLLETFSAQQLSMQENCVDTLEVSLLADLPLRKV